MQGGRIQVFLVIRIAVGGQPEVAGTVYIEGGHLINDIGRRARGNGFGKLEGVGGLHPHAAVAAYTGDACRGVCTVDAEAEFGIAQADKYRAERIFRSGRDGGYAVVQFFLN